MNVRYLLLPLVLVVAQGCSTQQVANSTSAVINEPGQGSRAIGGLIGGALGNMVAGSIGSVLGTAAGVAVGGAMSGNL